MLIEVLMEEVMVEAYELDSNPSLNFSVDLRPATLCCAMTGLKLP